MTLIQKIVAAIAADYAVLTDPFFIGLVISVIIGITLGLTLGNVLGRIFRSTRGKFLR
jgi:NhaP-type Na+/H+ or K+/H+ antiporter